MVKKAENSAQPPKRKQNACRKEPTKRKQNSGSKEPPKRKQNARRKEEEADAFVSAMGVDHYKILGVNRNASADEVKKAYKKLVMFWHPDKHHQEEARAEANAKFMEINQAYELLSDPVKRHKYDDHCAKRVMAEENKYDWMFGSTEKKVPKTGPVNHDLHCSLEELYKGTTKMMKITRPKPNSDPIVEVEEIFGINIKPGLRNETKIIYQGKGKVGPDGTASDLVFVIQEKQHSVYERDRNDLIVNQEITLLEALIGGKTLDLTTLDGRNLKVPLTDDVIIAPGDEMVVPNEGMPISNQPGAKGNLRIKFHVKFPSSSLTAEQKLYLTSLGF